MEVACLDADAVNEGSNVVTCTIGTDFIFYEEPSCSIPGFNAKFHRFVTLLLSASKCYVNCQFSHFHHNIVTIF